MRKTSRTLTLAIRPPKLAVQAHYREDQQLTSDRSQRSTRLQGPALVSQLHIKSQGDAMPKQSCRNFLRWAVAGALFAGCALANDHRSLNGVWRLIPAISQFNGEPAIQTGTVTINDREGNIFVQRNFNFDDAKQSTSTSFSTDSREKATIKEPGFKSKAKWDGHVLTVTTTRDGETTLERYSLRDDGTMMLQLDRPGHQPETLYFQRP
jgi:hypothetical protein